MPTLVPTHSVLLSRPVKSGRKNKAGDVIHERIVPKIGEPFDFTDEEADSLNTVSPLSVRAPLNETGVVKEDEEIERAVQEAHATAAANRGASADAALTAKTGAQGKGARKQPDNSGAAETAQAPDEDDL